MAQLLNGADLQAYMMPGVTAATLMPATAAVAGQSYFVNNQQLLRQQNSYNGMQKVVQVPGVNVQVVNGNLQVVPGLASSGQPLAIPVERSDAHVLSGQKLAAVQVANPLMNQCVQLRQGQPPFNGSLKPQMQTVRQVPAFAQVSHGQQVVQLQDRLLNTNLIQQPHVAQHSNVTSAAAAAALATTNQVSSNRYDTGLPSRTLLPAANANGLSFQQAQPVRPHQTPPISIAARAAAPCGMVGMTIRPGSVFTAAPPAGNMVRPMVRVPKLGTVSMYNPATGVRSAPVVNSTGSMNAMLSASHKGTHRSPQGTFVPTVTSTGLQMQPGGNGMQVAAAATTNGNQQRSIPMVSPHGSNQQQLLANLRARMAAANHMNGTRPPGIMATSNGMGSLPQQPIAVANHMNGKVYNASMAAAFDQNSLLTHLLEAQARNTVVKVPVSPTQPGRMMGLPQQDQYVVNGSHGRNLHATAAGMDLANNGLVHAMPAGMPSALQAVHSGAMDISTQLQQQQQQHAIKMTMAMMQPQSAFNGQMLDPMDAVYVPAMHKPLGAIGDLAQPGHSPLPASNGKQLLKAQPFNAVLPGSNTVCAVGGFDTAVANGMPSASENAMLFKQQQQQQEVAAMEAAAEPAAKEDLKVILASIGVELARHSISIESALAAGWLGILSDADVAILSKAHAEEEQCIREAGVCVVLSDNCSSTMPPSASCSASPTYVDSDASASISSNNSFDVSVGNSSNISAATTASQQMHSMQQDARVEPAQFNAFTYGFFAEKSDSTGDVNELLEPLETSDQSTPRGGAPVWGSVEGLEGANEGDGHAFFRAPSAMAGSALVGQKSCELAARFANLDLGCGFF